MRKRFWKIIAKMELGKVKKVFPSCSEIRLKKYTDSTPYRREKSVQRKNFFEGLFQPFKNDLEIRFFMEPIAKGYRGM